MELVNGSVPAEQLEALVESIRRDPSHPGCHIRATCERKKLSVQEAARQFGLPLAELTEVIEGRAPVSPELALKMEAPGWPSADLWIRLQSKYDLAQARLRLEGKGSDPAPSARAVESAVTAS